MKKAIYVALLGLGILLVSLFLMYWRLSVGAGCLLPELPVVFWVALFNFFNALGCESDSDVVMNVIAVLAISIVSLFTWLGLYFCPQNKTVLSLRQALPASLIGLWVLAAAWTITHWWLNAVTARVLPPPPETFRLWLLSLYGAKDVYEEQEVMALFGFAVATMIVSLLTWLALWLWRRIKKR